MITSPKVRAPLVTKLTADPKLFLGQPFADYMAHALKASSIAPAMKSLYESIKSCSIANITIHDLPLELQLPPYLDLLLHNDDLEDEFVSHAHDGEDSWGKDMGFAWRLPVLEPWKSLLLLDDDDSDDRGENLYMNLMGQNVMPEDRLLGEQLIKFLELTSITLSYALFCMMERELNLLPGWLIWVVCSTGI